MDSAAGQGRGMEPITYRMRLDPWGLGTAAKGYWWKLTRRYVQLREPRVRVYAVKP